MATTLVYLTQNGFQVIISGSCGHASIKLMQGWMLCFIPNLYIALDCAMTVGFERNTVSNMGIREVKSCVLRFKTSAKTVARVSV